MMERSTDSIGGAVKERKRPLLRVDTGAVSDQAVPFSHKHTTTPDQKNNGPGAEKNHSVPIASAVKSGRKSKAPAQLALPPAYKEQVRARVPVPISKGRSSKAPKAPNRVVLYGTVNLDPARDAEHRRGSLTARATQPAELKSDANSGAQTHRPTSNSAQLLPAVRDIGHKTRPGDREEGGGDRSHGLPEMKVFWRAPPKDSLFSPLASKQVDAQIRNHTH